MPGDVVTTDGAARRRKAQGQLADQIQQYLGRLDAAMPQWADEFVFGEVWGREGLDHDTRMIVAIAQLSATAQHAPLRAYLRGALELGIPSRRIHEVLVMTTVYCGFPTAQSALLAWHEILDETGRALDDDADSTG